MTKTYNIEPISRILQTARTALVLLPQNPSLDAVAAALTLYLSLSKKSVNVSIGCPSKMTVNYNRLFAVDKIKSHIGNQNLVISFNYPEDSLEKVAYDKDPQNQKFHLTIEPKAGHQPLDPNQVEFSYTGSNADLIFVVGARSLEDLGSLYQQEKNLFEDKNKTLVNLSTLDKNAQFGTVNLYDPTASGHCEIVFTLLKNLNFPLEPDMATNLLAGIEQSTDNLITADSPDTFEIIAELIRHGAKKGHLAQSLNPAVRSIPFQTPSIARPDSSLPVMPQSFPLDNLQTTDIPRPAPSASLSGADNHQPSPDWLKPKVYKSSDAQT